MFVFMIHLNQSSIVSERDSAPKMTKTIQQTQKQKQNSSKFN